MTATFLGVWKPGTPDWHDARKGRIGGSDIATIRGLSPYDSVFNLWHARKGMVPQQAENAAMSWGKRLEPVIVQAFAENHPEYDVAHIHGAVYAHQLRDWQVASPDALLEDDGRAVAGLEVKTGRFADEWGEPGTDEIPKGYLEQVRWCLDVFGLNVWHVAFLCSGSDYREYVVRRDDRHQAEQREDAMAFLASLENDERPDLDSSSFTYQAVRELHPDIEPEDVEVPAEVAIEYCTARAAAKAAKDRDQLATSALADVMGNAKRALYLGQTIASRQARGDGTPYVVAGRNLPTFTDSKDAA